MGLSPPPYISLLKDALSKIKDGHYIKVFEPSVFIQEVYFYLNEECGLNVKIENIKRTGYEIIQLISDYTKNITLFHNKTNGVLLIVRDDSKIIPLLLDNADHSIVQVIADKHGLKRTYSPYGGDFAVELYFPGREAVQQLRGIPWEKDKAQTEIRNRIYSIEYLKRVRGEYGWFFIARDQYAKLAESVIRDNFRLVEYPREHTFSAF